MTESHNIPERLVPGSLAWELYAVEHQQRYEFFAPQCRGLKVLDAACGVGYGTRILREQGASCVVGIDLAYDAVNYAASHYGAACVSFLAGNVQELPFDSHIFDIVLSFETLEHVPHPAVFLDQVKRVLKPNGLFICSTPNKEFVPLAGKKPHNPYHTSEMTLDEFKALVGQRFEIMEQYFQSHSPAFLRYVELLHYVEAMGKPVRFSKLLHIENRLRRLLGYPSWDEILPMQSRLGRAFQGDFVIEPLVKPANEQLTFILAGKNN